jgi:hypothetical protein
MWRLGNMFERYMMLFRGTLLPLALGKRNTDAAAYSVPHEQGTSNLSVSLRLLSYKFR